MAIRQFSFKENPGLNRLGFLFFPYIWRMLKDYNLKRSEIFKQNQGEPLQNFTVLYRTQSDKDILLKITDQHNMHYSLRLKINGKK